MNPDGNNQTPVSVPGQPQTAAPENVAATNAVPLTHATPAGAQDNDLIEKEWVVKAKEIIASTASDPSEQNRQLAALKADYIQKRYNKTVKLSE